MITTFKSEVMPSEYRAMVQEMADHKKMPVLVNFALLYDGERVDEAEATRKLDELVGVWRKAWAGDDWAIGMEEDPFIEEFCNYLMEEELDGEAVSDRGFLIAIEFEYVLDLSSAIHLLIKNAPDLLDTPVIENAELTEDGDRLADPNVVQDLLQGKRYHIDLPED